MFEVWGRHRKQGNFLNDHKSLKLDVITVRISLFDDYQMGGRVAVLFRKELNLEVRSIFRDPDEKLMVLDVSNS